MDSSQVFLTKPILQTLIHDTDLGNPFRRKKPLQYLRGKDCPQDCLTMPCVC